MKRIILALVVLVVVATESQAAGCGGFLSRIRANRHQRIADRINKRLSNRGLATGCVSNRAVVLSAAPAAAPPAVIPLTPTPAKPMPKK